MPFCLGRKLVVDGMSRPGLGCEAECCDPAAARPRADVGGGGTFDLINLFLKFGGLLKAVIGGFLYTSAR